MYRCNENTMAKKEKFMSDDLNDFFDKVRTGEAERQKTEKDGNTPSPRGSRGGDCAEEVPMDERAGDFNKGSFEDVAERRWAASDGKFWACQQTYDELPAGLYRPHHSNSIGYYLDKQTVDTDDIIILPDTASEGVLEEIEKFWTLKEEFIKRGFIHKRGVLLWGNPGSGKTSTIQLTIKAIVEAGGIALFANNPDTTVNCLQMMRKIEPTRPLVVILEDLDALVYEFGESGYLAMLDGESQVSNVVFIATTNYPEKLDKRFVDRPSRFDTIQLIPMPGEAARRVYLQTKEITLVDGELEHWVDISKGFSIAHLKEMIISNRCYGKPIEKVVKRLRKMNKNQLTSDDAVENDDKMGFHN